MSSGATLGRCGARGLSHERRLRVYGQEAKLIRCDWRCSRKSDGRQTARLIEAGIQSGDLGVQRELFEGRSRIPSLREDLAEQLRDGTLEDMTPEQARSRSWRTACGLI